MYLQLIILRFIFAPLIIGGEADEWGLVDTVLDRLFWDGVDDDWDSDGYPESSFVCHSRLWLIKYLKSLPTVRKDSKINKVLSGKNNGL